MFRWFNRSKPKQPPAEISATPAQLPMHTENGRPLRPRIHGFGTAEDATVEQRLQVLEWAKEWTGNSFLPVSTEELLGPLENGLIGKRLKAKDPARPVISQAIHALYLSARENRAERTKGAFPWTEFRLGPQEHLCRAAKQLANTFAPTTNIPLIPLPKCDESECSCWFRPVTKAEFAKRKSA